MRAERTLVRRGGTTFAHLSGDLVTKLAGIIGIAAIAMMMSAPVRAQAAQANWWEGITGYGAPDYSSDKERARERARERAAHARTEIDDLRPDPTPWLSDETIIAIRAAIDRYEHIVSRGGWPRVPEGRMLREGDDEERVAILRARLRASGDVQGRTPSYNKYVFDEALVRSVQRFQRRHGLRPTGRVIRSTIAALNVSAEERLAQLRLNLQRIRDLMRGPREDRYILVNVPAFQLEGVEKYEVHQRHRVIVGRTQRQSPVIDATVRALNFFPYWHVPESVARLDLIPRLLEEPDYLAKEKIRVLTKFVNGTEVDPRTVDWNSPEARDLKFRQDPGPQNALGLVRIDMPNAENVYMHDTPMKPLFRQRSRAFSAGCVRVQDVFELVDWIARHEPDWAPGRAQAIIAAGQPVDVTLTRPLPVHFVYITAWAERDGTIEFRPDIYGRDGAVDQLAEMDRDPNDMPPPVTLAP
jgi:L,D-transpeptidase YcbB